MNNSKKGSNQIANVVIWYRIKILYNNIEEFITFTPTLVTDILENINLHNPLLKPLWKEPSFEKIKHICDKFLSQCVYQEKSSFNKKEDQSTIIHFFMIIHKAYLEGIQEKRDAEWAKNSMLSGLPDF